MSEDVAYSLMTAVDLLDALAAGQTLPTRLLLRGTLVLALSCGAGDEDKFEVVQDLERLILGPDELDQAGRYRAGSMASMLRQTIGVH